jgi:hypothetical protein
MINFTTLRTTVYILILLQIVQKTSSYLAINPLKTYSKLQVFSCLLFLKNKAIKNEIDIQITSENDPNPNSYSNLNPNPNPNPNLSDPNPNPNPNPKDINNWSIAIINKLINSPLYKPIVAIARNKMIKTGQG